MKHQHVNKKASAKVPKILANFREGKYHAMEFKDRVELRYKGRVEDTLMKKPNSAEFQGFKVAAMILPGGLHLDNGHVIPFSDRPNES